MRSFIHALTWFGAFSCCALAMFGGCQPTPAELPQRAPIPEPAMPSTPAAPAARTCTVGQDQTCNENPAMSSLHGKCSTAGTCECITPFTKASSGRCN
ncbi:MAG: hypothetical protein ABI461_23800 [Polyangiaceae bacterium]